MPYAPVHVENPREVDVVVVVGHCAEVRSDNMWNRPDGAPTSTRADFGVSAHAYALPAGATLDTLPWLDSGCAEGAPLPLYVLARAEVASVPAAWTGSGWSARLDPGAGTPLRREDLQPLFAADPAGASDLWILASLAGTWSEPATSGRCTPGTTPAVFDVAEMVPLNQEPTPLGMPLTLPDRVLRRDRRTADGRCVQGSGRGVSEIWPGDLASPPAEVLVRACDRVAVLSGRQTLVALTEGWRLALAGQFDVKAWGLPFALDPACPVTLAKRHVTHSVTYVAGPFVAAGDVLVVPPDARWRLATDEEDAALATWPGWRAFTRL